MRSVAAALELIEQTIEAAPVELRPLGECLGLTLAEAIVSQQDSPPFNKALMDGYSIRAEDLQGVGTTFRVQEKCTAGEVPQLPQLAGTATQVMTGTATPQHADAVVRLEDVALLAAAETGQEERIRVEIPEIAPGRNLMHQGESMRAGETVLEPGVPLSAAQIGLLAELGRAEVPVHPAPRVAILATGNELVPVSETPAAGEIRNSNEPMLIAQVLASGGIPIPLGIARDDRADLRKHVEQGLQADFLLLTGGVSAGLLDLVPAVLAECGVTQVFHKVNLKPGKPIWFGQHAAGAGGAGCAVFGLPGNPVSSLVCFELFVKPALRLRQGRKNGWQGGIPAELGQAHLVKGDRPVYYPARWSWKAGKLQAQPVRWLGSADLRGTATANGMILFEPRESPYTPGELVPLFPWESEWPAQ